MTSNRDALRAPYDGAFQSFLDDLSVDVRSAMKDQEDRKHVRIEGGLGKLRAKRDVMEIADAMDFVTAPSHAPSGGARPIAPEKYERSEEHTSELQSLMRISYAVFCLKKKTKK